jgi:hypothetical protein
MGKKFAVTLTKTGACQGAASIQEYDLPTGLRAKVLCLKVDYRVASGTFNAGSTSSDSDLIFYIEEYNGTSWEKKEPSTFKLFSNSSTIADQYSGYFQTNADTTKIRIIAYVATAGNNNFSLVCSFSLSATKYVYGTPITDWVEYTPQFNTGFTVGTGGNAANKWFWRRVGGSIQIRGGFVLGTSGFSMGSGNFEASLPSGLSFDSSKLTWQFDRIGVFDTHDSNQTNMREVGAVYVPGTSNTFRFIQRRVDNTSGVVNANFPFTWAADDELYCRIEAPIQGWSSSVKMSDGYDGREIIVGLTGGSVSVPHNTSPKITGMSIDSRSKDTTASWDAANSRYIVPVSGFYRITGHGLFLSNGSAGNAINAIRLFRNGAFYSDIARRDTLAAENQALSCFISGQTNPFYLVAGDIIEFNAFQTSGVTRTFNGFYFSIERISSPQTIAMGEVVAGYAKNTSGQSIPNSTDTVLTSWTVESDTHAIFNPSTGVLTVNRAGFIDMVFSVAFQQNGSGARSCHIYKNNTEFVGVDDRAPLSSWPVSAKAIVSAYPVKAGDTFVFRAWQNSGSSLNIDGSLNKTYITWRIY